MSPWNSTQDAFVPNIQLFRFTNLVLTPWPMSNGPNFRVYRRTRILWLSVKAERPHQVTPSLWQFNTPQHLTWSDHVGGGGGPPREQRHEHDSIRPSRVTAALGLKKQQKRQTDSWPFPALRTARKMASWRPHPAHAYRCPSCGSWDAWFHRTELKQNETRETRPIHEWAGNTTMLKIQRAPQQIWRGN